MDIELFKVFLLGPRYWTLWTGKDSFRIEIISENTRSALSICIPGGLGQPKVPVLMLDLQSGEDPGSLDAVEDVDSTELCSDAGKNCIQLDQPEF